MTHWRVQRFSALMVLAASVTACQLNLAGIPVAVQSASVDAGASGQGFDASVPSNASMDSGFVRDAALRLDAGSTLPGDADSGPRDDAALGQDASVSNVACVAPLPSVLPPQPLIRRDAKGRPEFDSFVDYACEAVATLPTCDTRDVGSPYSCTHCLVDKTDHPALCLDTDQADIVGCIPIIHADGSCVDCVRPESKARACCLGLDFDCRAWPFLGSSRVGEVCANHDDCEPGLLCKLTTRTGVAACACPEQEPGEQLPEPGTCIAPRGSLL